MCAAEYINGSDDDEEYTGMSSEQDDDLTWVDWFCSVKGNEFFVEVEEEYIRDNFNLTGLNSEVKHFERALDVILDEAEEDDEEEDDDDDDEEDGPEARMSSSSIMASAQTLYGLIHARYILTHRGLSAMLQKYNSYVFGFCPNVFCGNQPVVPIGMSDRLGSSSTNVFCPRCNEVYFPQSCRLANVDGSFFGTTFPHMFFLQYDHLIPNSPLHYYVPKIYGFNVWRGVKDLLRNEAVQVHDDPQANKSTTQRPGINKLTISSELAANDLVDSSITSIQFGNCTVSAPKKSETRTIVVAK